ncbi:unnamed protein product [Mytilus edulis]|uniref:Uncharacterized protein n=1 Tax=Mytilus edulis TaxID=6550 RepID=A0A8S3QH52_MYTED|nr:unnamed protein product [Mytilus edulis]
MLDHYMSRLCSFILLMCAHVTLSEIIKAHTGFDYIMVVVMNNNFKGFTPVTTCESTKDKSRDENRNSTVIHTKSYFSESSSFSFDIEIKTVCQPSFCFGLRCEKCASNRMTTQDSSIEYITSYKTPSHSSRKVTSRHKTTTHSSRKVTSRHKTTTYSIPTGSAASLVSFVYYY